MVGLARGGGQRLVEARTSPAGGAVALAWTDGERTILWVANLTAEPLKLGIEGLAEHDRRLSVIDASVFEQVVRNPDALDALARPFEGKVLRLDAYATARLD
jgi:hypothetical protein